MTRLMISAAITISILVFPAQVTAKTAGNAQFQTVTQSSSVQKLTTSKSSKVTKTKIQVVRKALPMTRQSLRTLSKGRIIMVPETSNDDMVIYRPANTGKRVRTTMPNLYKH